MSTQLFISGPAHAWVGGGPYNWGGLNTWNFVGYSRNGLSVQITPIWEDIEADHAAKMPADAAMFGQRATVSGIFVKYDEAIVTSIASFGTSVNPGGFDDNALGLLAVSENAAYPLLISSPYCFKTAYGAMVPGFIFYATILDNPYDVTLSLRPKTPSLGWRALPVFGNGSGDSFQPGIQPLIASRLYTNLLPNPLPSPT
jgi:hypothetical protein